MVQEAEELRNSIDLSSEEWLFCPHTHYSDKTMISGWKASANPDTAAVFEVPFGVAVVVGSGSYRYTEGELEEMTIELNKKLGEEHE